LKLAIGLRVVVWQTRSTTMTAGGRLLETGEDLLARVFTRESAGRGETGGIRNRVVAGDRTV